MRGLNSASARAYVEAVLPAPSTPWREARFSVVDLELTGLDPAVDEFISFASVTVAGGRVSLTDAHYRLIRPRRMPDAETIRIHGLREADLAGAPPLDSVLDEILEAITGRALVAHVAKVEEGFLRAALSRWDLEFRNPMIDTALLATELRRRRHQRPLPRGWVSRSGPAVSSPGLAEVAGSLGLPVHRPHHADGDALTTAQVFLALATHLDALEPQTVGSLERASLAVSEGPARRALRRLVRALRRLG